MFWCAQFGGARVAPSWGKSDSREVDMRGCASAAVLAAVLVAGEYGCGLRATRRLRQRCQGQARQRQDRGRKEPSRPIRCPSSMCASSPPKVLAELEVPNSVVGPPTNVAVSPKEDIVLVASAMQIDPVRSHQDHSRRQGDRHRHRAPETRHPEAAGALQRVPRPRPR